MLTDHLYNIHKSRTEPGNLERGQHSLSSGAENCHHLYKQANNPFPSSLNILEEIQKGLEGVKAHQSISAERLCNICTVCQSPVR